MSKLINSLGETNTKKIAMDSSQIQKRKTFINKLKQIKLLCDSEQKKQYRLEFYYLLTNRDYRNACLEKLKSCPRKDIADLAQEIMEFKINRNILKDVPCLGDEVVLRFYAPQFHDEQHYFACRQA